MKKRVLVGIGHFASFSLVADGTRDTGRSDNGI